MTATLTSPTFVGRTEELARLAAAVERAAGGVPTSVLIGGEAGVGKTRLVAEFVAAARAAGVTALHGGCVELGGEGLPFAPLVEALRAFVRDLASPRWPMVPGRSGSSWPASCPSWTPGRARRRGPAAFDADPGPWSEPGRLFELLLGLLERLASDRPVLLVLEDLHWADRSTRDLLGFLYRTLHHLPPPPVVTYRADDIHRRHPLRPFLAELDRGHRATRRAAPLDPAEVHAQLAGIRGAPPPPSWRRITPAPRATPSSSRSWPHRATDGELPPTLRDPLLARVEPLPDHAQRVLQILAVAAAAVPTRCWPPWPACPRPSCWPRCAQPSRPTCCWSTPATAPTASGTPWSGGRQRRAAAGRGTRLHARSRPPWPAATAGASPAGRRAGLALVAAHAGAGPPGRGRGRGGRRARLRLRRGPAPVRARPGAVGAGRPPAAARRRPRQTAPLARAGEAAANAGAADRAVALVRPPWPRSTGRRPAAGCPAHRAPRLPPAGRRRPEAFEAYQEAVRLVPRSRRRPGPGSWPASGRR